MMLPVFHNKTTVKSNLQYKKSVVIDFCGDKS